MVSKNLAELLAPFNERLKELKLLNNIIGGRIESKAYDNIELTYKYFPKEETQRAFQDIIDQATEIHSAVKEGYIAFMDKAELKEITRSLISLLTGGEKLPADEDKIKKTIEFLNSFVSDELQSCIDKFTIYLDEIQKYHKGNDNKNLPEVPIGESNEVLIIRAGKINWQVEELSLAFLFKLLYDNKLIKDKNIFSIISNHFTAKGKDIIRESIKSNYNKAKYDELKVNDLPTQAQELNKIFTRLSDLNELLKTLKEESW